MARSPLEWHRAIQNDRAAIAANKRALHGSRCLALSCREPLLLAHRASRSRLPKSAIFIHLTQEPTA